MKKLLSSLLFIITAVPALASCSSPSGGADSSGTVSKSLNTHTFETAYKDGDNQISDSEFSWYFSTDFQKSKMYKQARIVMHAENGFSEEEKTKFSISEDPIIFATVRDGINGFSNRLRTFFGTKFALNCNPYLFERSVLGSYDCSLALNTLDSLFEINSQYSYGYVKATTFYKYKVLGNYGDSVCYFNEDYLITSYSVTVNERKFTFDFSYFNEEDAVNPDRSELNERLFGYMFARANNLYTFSNVHAHAEGSVYHAETVTEWGVVTITNQEVISPYVADEYYLLRNDSSSPVNSPIHNYNSMNDGFIADTTKENSYTDGRRIGAINGHVFVPYYSTFLGGSDSGDTPRFIMNFRYVIEIASSIYFKTNYSESYTISYDGAKGCLVSEKADSGYREEVYFNDDALISKIIYIRSGENKYQGPISFFEGTVTFEYSK